MSKQWMSLKDAAAMLGVHPSTVRKWSNEGKLPVYLTDGGHRRYVASEVELWQQSRVNPEKVDTEKMIQQVIGALRVTVRGLQLESEGWYTQLDPEAREQFRSSGRFLVQGMVQILASPGEDSDAQAQSVGYEYASRSRKYHIPTTAAVRAFLFFRSHLLEAIVSAYQSARITSPAAWGEMVHKFDQFTDRALLIILETNETHG